MVLWGSQKRTLPDQRIHLLQVVITLDFFLRDIWVGVGTIYIYTYMSTTETI
jgi:hypothetical protein